MKSRLNKKFSLRFKQFFMELMFMLIIKKTLEQHPRIS